jgi:putative peptidoglycan lipid II flippase
VGEDSRAGRDDPTTTDDEAGSQDGSGALSGGRLGAAAMLLALSVLLSRVMGFLREMVLAAEVGNGPQVDAYRAAFQIPDLLNYLLAGGALAVAFTPLYQRARSEEGQAAASSLYHVVLSTLGALAVLATALLWLDTPRLVALQFPGFDPDVQDLTSSLTRIVLPAQVFFIAGGVARAVLMAHGRFAAQAAAPLVYNGGIIAGGLATGTVEGFAWGALAGAALGPFLYPLFALRHIAPLRLDVRPLDPRFRRYLWLALPLMAGVSLSTVDEWLGRWFGARLAEGTVGALGYARQLMMAPVAVIGQAAAAAALPTLAALHARGDGRALDGSLSNTLRVTLALSMLAATALGLFAREIVEVLYFRGAFTAGDVADVAAILQVGACAVPAWIAQQVGVRAFFARSDNWRPMILNTGLLVASLPLYLWLGDRFGAPGLAGAGVVAMTVNATATLVWARVRFDGPDFGPIVGTGVRSILIAGAAGAVAYLVPRVDLPVLGEAWGRLLSAGLVYGVLSIAGVLVLGDAQMRAAVATLTWGRLGRRAP